MSEWKPKVGDMVQTKPMRVVDIVDEKVAIWCDTKSERLKCFRYRDLQPVALSADGGSVVGIDELRETLFRRRRLEGFDRVDAESWADNVIEALTAAGFAVVKKETP